MSLESEKIRCTVVGELKTTGRRLYLPIDKKLQEVYALRIGDVVKVEILAVFRKPKDEDSA